MYGNWFNFGLQFVPHYHDRWQKAIATPILLIPATVLALGKIKSEKIIPLLKIALKDPNLEVVELANLALKNLKLYPTKTKLVNFKMSKDTSAQPKINSIITLLFIFLFQLATNAANLIVKKFLGLNFYMTE